MKPIRHLQGIAGMKTCFQQLPVIAYPGAAPRHSLARHVMRRYFLWQAAGQLTAASWHSVPWPVKAKKAVFNTAPQLLAAVVSLVLIIVTIGPHLMYTCSIPCSVTKSQQATGNGQRVSDTHDTDNIARNIAQSLSLISPSKPEAQPWGDWIA